MFTLYLNMILIFFICLFSGNQRWWFSQNGSLWLGVNNKKLSFYLKKETKPLFFTSKLCHGLIQI